MDERKKEKKTGKEIREAVLEWIHALAVIAFVVLAFVGCFRVTAPDENASKEKLQEARDEGYSEGYNEGYDNGVEAMAEYAYGLIQEEQEKTGVQEIQAEILERYGVTPWEAWSLIDNYNYDSSHGGVTWEEYQNAIEAVLDTAGSFPMDE